MLDELDVPPGWLPVMREIRAEAKAQRFAGRPKNVVAPVSSEPVSTSGADFLRDECPFSEDNYGQVSETCFTLLTFRSPCSLPPAS